MRPEERENERYKNEDFCEISQEERIMFSLLKKYKPPQKTSSLRVLDLGCGSGRITKKIKNLGYEVTGLDFSSEAVAKAQSKGIDAKQANLDEGIAEPENSFDVVWAGDIVEHVFDPIGLLKNSYRVLKPSGIMLITIPSDVGLVSRMKMLFGISHQEGMYRKSGFYKHHTFFTPRLIRFMLSKASLRIISFQKILILGGRRYALPWAPSFLFNEMILAVKKEK